MNFTEEQLKKINGAKSAEELMALAKAEGIEMSEEEIKAKFAEMHKEGEIADDELNNVAGGCDEDDRYNPQVGDGVIHNPTGKGGVIISEDSKYFSFQIYSMSGVGGTAYSAGYEVQLEDGTTVWASANELSPAGWVSF